MNSATVGDKYRIHELIGEGAMGSVYEAEHLTTRRRCAIKVVSSLAGLDDEELVGRFGREARAAGALSSRHIVQIFDAGVDAERDMPFMAMEYLEGEDLGELLRRLGPLPPALALRIAAQACLGLDKAHQADVVHRDVKPQNLFLCLEDADEVVVKLLDFGIAKVKMDRASTVAGADLTAPGSVLGSPRYMSPEQARARKNIDRRTDIWSLGALLYQALCGHSPYHEHKTLGDLMLALCSSEPPPLGEQAPWVEAEIASLVHRCLQLDPAARFATARELFEAIVPLVGGSWTIQRDMLVPLDDEQRAGRPDRDPSTVAVDEAAETSAQTVPLDQEQAAPPTSAQPAADAAELAVATAETVALSAERQAEQEEAEVTVRTAPAPAAPAGELGTAPSADTQSAAATQPMLRSPVAATPVTKSRSPMVIGLAAVVIAALVVGAWVALRRSDSSPADPAAAQASAGKARPLPAGAAPNGRDDRRQVLVVIVPSDAKVEVEGKPAELRDGVLAIRGSVGDVYPVRVFKDDAETIADVVISKDGALPAKIELEPHRVVKIPQAGATPTAKPAGTAQPAAPTATATEAAPPDPLQMDPDEAEFQ